ncbi:hypothetical protein [Natrononativus amylolyticus]|uniref:hypothetical protein n=1 Tax=Natrononativus amylolyticus TaxID=2963434 RepID=UPI0020CBB94F|nr:hypothetical protein [Natrononativus amylolyticus]
MSTSLRQFLVLFAGTLVAALVLTVVLDPPGATASAVTFVVIMIAGITLSYVIGYLGVPWEATAYTDSTAEPTPAAREDTAAFRGLVVEGIGVAIASLFGMLLLALFLLEETRLVRSQGLSTGEIAEWVLLVGLALALAAVALWSWRRR